MFQRLRFLPKGDPLASPHRRVPWFSLGVFAMLFVCGLFPGLVAPMDPLKANFLALNAPPLTTAGGQLYLLGSDHLGRDVLSRIVHGSSIALYVSLIAVLFSSVIGTTLGLLAGYYRGWVDQLVMRVADTWIALPTVSFAIFLTAMREPGATNIIIVMILVFWTRYARIVRGEVLSLRERDFVKLAITAGASPLRILFVHLLPNVINSVIVLATLLIGNVILQYDRSFEAFDSSTVAGLEFRDASTTSAPFYGLYTPIDVANPVYSGAPGALAAPYELRDNDYKTQSLFVQQNLSFDDKIIATVGLRHDWLDIEETLNGVRSSGDYSETSIRGALNPSAPR